MAPASNQQRLLSTSARVHPSYLPYIHTAATKSPVSRGMKWVPPLVGVMAAGYAVASYRQVQVSKQVMAAEAADLERRRKNLALADAYGDRSSLEELERAMRVYEAQQSQ
ncbi:hypothetical protein QBC35DRAFT_380348 [Podospora australis]|uniref:Uncharacterized protein n=1 Tax=Podospora australis TaxID=1536484 RepID=A0AAN6WWT0_9PEZI|nr:hypothetical protein QBC35DRAFT_380348 [Podospora australis]